MKKTLFIIATVTLCLGAIRSSSAQGWVHNFDLDNENTDFATRNPNVSPTPTYWLAGPSVPLNCLHINVPSAASSSRLDSFWTENGLAVNGRTLRIFLRVVGPALAAINGTPQVRFYIQNSNGSNFMSNPVALSTFTAAYSLMSVNVQEVNFQRWSGADSFATVANAPTEVGIFFTSSALTLPAPAPVDSRGIFSTGNGTSLYIDSFSAL